MKKIKVIEFVRMKFFFPHTPWGMRKKRLASESGTFPPCGLDEGATFR